MGLVGGARERGAGCRAADRPVPHGDLGPARPVRRAHPVADDDRGAGSGRVLGDVRQRLLDDPVRGQVDGPRHRHVRRFPLHLQPDVESRPGGPVHEASDRGEPVRRSALRPGRRVRGFAQNADHLPEPVHGGSRPGSDVARGDAVGLGEAGGQLQRSRRQGDEAEFVAEEVVHVLRDPGPFAQSGPFGEQALFPL